MRVTALDPAEPCGYCGSDWQPTRGGYAHTCRPVRARVVTLAESLEAYRARRARRPKPRASKPRVKFGEVFGGLPVGRVK